MKDDFEKDHPKQVQSDNKKSEREIELDGIEKIIMDKEPGLLEDIDPEKREAFLLAFSSILTSKLKLTRISRETFQGPLPHPELLKKYNEVVPDAAERIFKMAENQSAHRIAMEIIKVKSVVDNIFRSQIFAFIIALVFGGLSCILVLTGHDTAGIAIGGTTLVGIVSAFLIGKKNIPPNKDNV